MLEHLRAFKYAKTGFTQMPTFGVQLSCLKPRNTMGGVAEVFVDCCRPDEADERPDADADEGVKQAEHTIAHPQNP